MDAITIRRRKILLVDDDVLILSVLSQILQDAGHETIQATSGEEALRKVIECNPDMALIDFEMPGMTGMELARRLNAETRTAFMFVSAHGRSDLVRQASEYGAVGYLLKPLDMAQIMPVLETALARADEIRHLRRTEENLTAALHAGRETSMAVGLLMRAYQTDRNKAFDVLRDYSRSHRRKINDVAKEILAAEEMFSALKMLFATQPAD